MTVIGFFSRYDEHGFPGGDTVQATAIASFLSQQGYTIHRINFPWSEVGSVDLAVVFNLTRPFEAYLQAQAAVSVGVPYIVFSVYWDLDSLPVRGTFIDAIKSLLPRRVKDFVRLQRLRARYPLSFAVLPETIVGAVKKSQWGHWDAMVQHVLDHALLVIPNSTAELAHLKERFSLTKTSSSVIYNGLNIAHIQHATLPDHVRAQLPERYLCCVGAVGPRKNQLTLVKAAREIGVHLVIVGGAAPGAERYERAVRKAAGPTVHFLGRQSRDVALGVMAESTGHIQPSYIETPGLASLEAAALGRPVGVSNVAPVREYFGDYALYCEPTSQTSVAETLLHLSQSQPQQQLAAYVHEKFSWEHVLLPMTQILADMEFRICRQ